MKLIGHRGFADTFPENTLRAFQNIPVHADMIELDLRRCQSGEIVVIHDGIVNTVTNSSGRVSDHSATELADLNVLDSGQGVPTLSTVLETIPSGVGLNLELKEYGLAKDVIEMVGNRGIEIVISSVKTAALREVKEVDPSIPTAIIFTMNPGKKLKTAERLGCTHVQPHWAICLTTDLIDRAHEMGIEAYVWSIDTVVGTQILRSLGADGVIADKPVVVDQPPSYCSQREPVFGQPSVQNVGVTLLPIVLQSVVYPLVVLGACITFVGWCLRSILSNASRNGRVHAIIAKSRSMVERELLIFLWKGKALATTSNGRWWGASQLGSAKKSLSVIVGQGISRIRHSEFKRIAEANKLQSDVPSAILSICTSATNTLHDVLTDGLVAVGRWGGREEK